MDVAPDLQISLLDEVKAQARVLVPLLKALRTELGEARANAIVFGALREWQRSVYERIGRETPGDPWTRLGTMILASAPRIGSDVDVDWTRQEHGDMEFKVTGCRYADFFRALGEPELGAILLCEVDDHVAATTAPDVEFRRENTIMKGGAYCDFRYRLLAGARERRS